MSGGAGHHNAPATVSLEPASGPALRRQGSGDSASPAGMRRPGTLYSLAFPPVAPGTGGVGGFLSGAMAPEAMSLAQQRASDAIKNFYFNWNQAGFAYFPKTHAADPRMGWDAVADDVPGVTRGRLSCSSKLQIWLDETLWGRIMDVVQVVLSIVSCIMYILTTYMEEDEVPAWIFWLDVVFAVIFAVDYVLRFIAAEKKFSYCISPLPMVDVLTVVPVFLEMAGDDVLRLDFLRMVRFLRVIRIFRCVCMLPLIVWPRLTCRTAGLAHGIMVVSLSIFKLLRVLRMYRILRMSDSGITKQIMTMVWTLISIVFCAAGLIQILEEEGGYEHDFFTAVYFVVVTITTVGYGDIVAKTGVGKNFTVFLILFTFIVIPLQAQTLAELIRLRPKHRGRYIVTPVPHVLVVGSIDYETVSRFLAEFFHDVHGMQETRVVFMAPGDPDQQLLGLLQRRAYVNRTLYLQGTVFEDPDLVRAGAHTAKACFVLSHGFRLGYNIVESDQATILRTAALRNASDTPEIFAELVDPELKTQLLASGANHAMCTDEIKMSVLAMSVLCPGFSTLLTNLITSNDPPEEALFMLEKSPEVARGSASPRSRMKRQRSFRRQRRLREKLCCCCEPAKTVRGRPRRASLGMHDLSSSNILRTVSRGFGAGPLDVVTWLHEYELGAAMEVYGLKLPKRYDGLKFPEAALDMFTHFGAILFAVKVELRRSPFAASRYVRTAARPSSHKDADEEHHTRTVFRANSHTINAAAAQASGGSGGRAGGGIGLKQWDSFGNLDLGAKTQDAAREDARTALVLNPGKALRLRAGDLCFVICLNEQAAYDIVSSCSRGDLPPVSQVMRTPTNTSPERGRPPVSATLPGAVEGSGSDDEGSGRSLGPLSGSGDLDPLTPLAGAGALTGTGSTASRGHVLSSVEERLSDEPGTKQREVDGPGDAKLQPVPVVAATGHIGTGPDLPGSVRTAPLSRSARPFGASSLPPPTHIRAHSLTDDHGSLTQLPTNVSVWTGSPRHGSNLKPPNVYLPFKQAQVTCPMALQGHTIVFPGQSLSTLDSFLLPLREVPETQWNDVVILSPNIDEVTWERIRCFPRVYWYRGTPLAHKDLISVNIVRAASVIIMADPSATTRRAEYHDLGVTGKHMEKHMVDYSTIMTGYAIQNVSDCHAHVVSELVYPSNGKFLRTREAESSIMRRIHTLSTVTSPPSLRVAGSLAAEIDIGRPQSHPAHASHHSLRPVVEGTPADSDQAAADLAFDLGAETPARLHHSSYMKSQGPGEPASESQRSEMTAHMASQTAQRHASTKEFFQLESFAAGSFFSPQMLQLLLFQGYFNRYLLTIVGGLLRCGTGNDIRAVQEAADGVLAREEDLASMTPDHHVEFTGVPPRSGGASQPVTADGPITPGGSSTAADAASGAGGGAGVGACAGERRGSTGPPLPNSAPFHPPRGHVATGGVPPTAMRGGHPSSTAFLHSPTGGSFPGLGLQHGHGVNSHGHGHAAHGHHPAHTSYTPRPPKGSEQEGFHQSFLRQVAVPSIMDGQPFSAVFRHMLLTKGALVLAVLRAPWGPTQAPHSYVYTNPTAESVMARDDRLFCLVHDSATFGPQH